jgi:branched-chain amino acid transport system substrate-binding protein
MKRGVAAVWVSAAVALSVVTLNAGSSTSAAKSQPLPSSFCSKVSSGTGTPDYLIVSDLAAQGNSVVVARFVAAIEFVLAQHGFKAGRYSVGYQSCDDSTPQTPQGDLAKCASNAKAYAANPSVIGVIGTWSSDCAGVELPIIGRSPTGPLALVSPINTNPGLTHSSGGSAPGEPGRYYPSGRRNFARLIAPDDFQGVAAAVLAKQLGLRRVFVLDDAEQYGLDVAGGFRRAARNLHFSVVGSASWHVSQSQFDEVAMRVARAHPDGILLGGYGCAGCAALIKALRAHLPRSRLIAPEGFLPLELLVRGAGSSVEGMYVIESGLPPTAFGTLGQTLQRKFGNPAATLGGATTAGQAAEVLLNAIARSDGTRSSVTAHALGDPVRGNILGHFSFDPNGDMIPSAITIYRVRLGHQVVDRVVRR